MNYSIIFCHAGDSFPPSHLYENFNHLSNIENNLNIILICQSNHYNYHISKLKLFDIKCNINYINIEDIPCSIARNLFISKSTLDSIYRSGFWFNATLRFLLISDFIKFNSLDNILHLENDYVLYENPLNIIAKCSLLNDFMVTFDNTRVIPGIVWIKDSHTADLLANYLANNSNIDDMNNLNNFCTTLNSTSCLPTIPSFISNSLSLDYNRFSSNIDIFNGIFDAAAIGQYIGGVHWLNNQNNTILFENESSALKLNHYDLNWNVIKGRRNLSFLHNGVIVDILGIHAHSKNIIELSQINHGVKLDCEDYITGERLQAIADITITSEDTIKFHGIDNIRTKNIWMIDKCLNGNFIPPNIFDINYIKEAKIIFIYTHLLEYFELYISKHLKNSYVLITHNSDHSITYKHNELLNSKYLIKLFSQNIEFDHDKIVSLPIGLQNSQWGNQNLDILKSLSYNIIKKKLLYANFSTSTHSSRSNIINYASISHDITIEHGLSYYDYLSSLSIHKFCLCPRGNGIDTHRFWECQYLDVIPIIIKSDWTKAYSELPVLILNDWQDIININLIEEYHKIKLQNFNFKKLDFSYYKYLITNSICS